MGNATHTETDARLGYVIQDAQKELTALRRELAKFQGIFDSARLVVGHEFTRPLTSISGYLDLLEERLGSSVAEKERTYFVKIRDSVARLEELVESFVQMLRVENGAGDLQAFERVDVRGLIDKVRERFEEHAGLISLQVEPPLPPLLLRRRCLEVVLENLVSNALKHGGGRPVRIAATITKERRGSSKGQCGPSQETLLVVTVEDHGEGIPEDRLEDIFTPFVRLENGGNREGLGLGLAIVKNIITIMRGEIRVRSKRGEGTAVTIMIPVTNDTRMLSDTVG